MARVLIAEDSDVVRGMFHEAVEQAGHTVDFVATQQEAEELLSTNLYDLVICKMVLPDGSGLELAVKGADLAISAMVMAGGTDSLEATTIAGVIHLRNPYGIAEFRKLIDDQLGA